MSSRFLSDEQRAQYGRYAADPSEEQLARHFHLDTADRELVGQMRGAHNRLGFAVQLGTVRFLGTFLDDLAQTPSAVITTMARQLGEVPTPSLDSYRDGRQRWRHAATIRERYGFRDLDGNNAAGFRLTRWLYVLCWTGDDRPGLLFNRAITWLLAHKVLLPGISTLERLIGRVRHRATVRLWHRLTHALSDERRQKLVALVSSGGDTLVALDDLRATPKRRSSTELLRHLKRIDAIREHGLGLVPSPDLPAAPVARLARSARAAKPANLAALHEPRRTATLAALFQTLEAIALDDALELFDALATDIFSHAEEAHRKSRLRSLRDLDAAAMMLRDVGKHVVADGNDALAVAVWRKALFEQIAQADIKAAMASVDLLVIAPDDRRHQELGPYWRRVRTLFSALLQRITPDASPAGQPIIEALNYLRGINDWTKAPMAGAPTEFLGPAWKRHALDDAGRVADNRAYADTVFGLFWLLGYQFSPRLADIGDARFWRVDKTADYGVLDGLARHRLDIDLIKRNWEDLLRLAGSLKLGRIHAGAIMRVLQVKDRPTTLARALAELGRIIKTLHLLGYIDSKEKRRRILTQLNRQEFRHRLARRVCHGDRGEIRKAYRQEQEEQLGTLGLTLNAIALWNATYIQAALDQLIREGWDISQPDIARISPLAFKHINFLGRYAFDLPQAVAEGALRPLRHPNSE